MFYQRDQRGVYVLRGMEVIALSGDAYTTEGELYKVCHRENRYLTYSAFREDLHYLLKEKYLYLEGRRLYTTLLWRYEQSAAQNLAHILKNPFPNRAQIPEKLEVNGVHLTEEQHSAVELALSSCLSLILGGAGSGKTTLVRTIMDHRPSKNGWVLCSPTGKAARNLTDRTGFQARTVHSALGMRPDEDFLSPVAWAHTDLVIVGEASMMTLEMLAGILSVVHPACHVVLIGDPHQLLSVGPGNVLPDLLTLDVPHIRLSSFHRQADANSALAYNVREFGVCRSLDDLRFDKSFQFIPRTDDTTIRNCISKGGINLYKAGADVQVLSPYNRSGILSSNALNVIFREYLNPATAKNTIKDVFLRTGDRVIIQQND